MPIIKDSYGRHKDVIIVTFGTGDIYMTKCREVDFDNDNLLCFSEIAGFEVGEESNLYEGESIDRLPNLQVVFRFENPKSITALIHSLIELQESVFKNTENK